MIYFGTLDTASCSSQSLCGCFPVGVQMFVCNREHYGYLPVPLREQQTLKEEAESFSHTLTEAMRECLTILQVMSSS